MLDRSHAGMKSTCIHMHPHNTQRNNSSRMAALNAVLATAAVQHTHAMIGHGMLRAHLRVSRLMRCSVEHPHLTRSACSLQLSESAGSSPDAFGSLCACVQLKSARTIYRSRECASARWLEHNLECEANTVRGCVGVWAWVGGWAQRCKWLFPSRAMHAEFQSPNPGKLKLLFRGSWKVALRTSTAFLSTACCPLTCAV
jgi:hypothetical protein